MPEGFSFKNILNQLYQFDLSRNLPLSKAEAIKKFEVFLLCFVVSLHMFFPQVILFTFLLLDERSGDAL